ncbi:hypothetical protein B296_00028415 [Ensete ventricosum]|uniref:Uncharacterized protein n=1 Tax=Ensete ventricosum TaxID=4639 RepID=A0A427AAL5_ENSVE|nr:hypothetical protein B296_00028415 [Ensete ventricosum]
MLLTESRSCLLRATTATAAVVAESSDSSDDSGEQRQQQWQRRATTVPTTPGLERARMRRLFEAHRVDIERGAWASLRLARAPFEITGWEKKSPREASTRSLHAQRSPHEEKKHRSPKILPAKHQEASR